MRDVRIVFFGTNNFAAAILRTLIAEKYRVIAVISQPDRPVGRRHIIMPTPVHALADECGIKCLAPEKLSEAADDVLALAGDLIVTCAYGQFVPSSILNNPRLGCVNIHPSLLPKYRGGAPIHYALLNGDKQTGVCLMEMTKEMDAGRIWAKTIVDIDPDEIMAELSRKLVKAAADLVKNFLPMYIDGQLSGEIQDASLVSYAKNITPEEERVYFQKESLDDLYNHIRALNDWPVAYGVLNGRRIKFYKVRKEVKDVSEAPGTVLGFKRDYMEIACRGGILKVYEIQPEGKKKMSAAAFANGYGRDMKGEVFG